MAGRIKLELTELYGDIIARDQIFLDVDNLSNLEDLESIVKNTPNFILIITEGVWESEWVQKVHWAVESGKNIILVQDGLLPSFPTFDSIQDKFVDDQIQRTIQKALKIRAIPYHREIQFRKTSLKCIVDALKLN